MLELADRDVKINIIRNVQEYFNVIVEKWNFRKD
jgi:hypothetical protein